MASSTHYMYQAGTAAKMPCWVKVLFSLPRYTIRAMYTVHAVHVLAFWNGIGTDLSVMAFFIALGRSFDALTDPFMGWITDNTKSRLGRRKPYMILGPITYGTVIILHVSPNREWDSLTLSLWFGVTYLAFFLCDTAASVPYYSLKYELCTDNTERTRIFMFTVTASFIGLLIGTGMPAGLSFDSFGGMDAGLALQVTMLHFALIYTIGMWGSCGASAALDPATRGHAWLFSRCACLAVPFAPRSHLASLSLLPQLSSASPSRATRTRPLPRPQ